MSDEDERDSTPGFRTRRATVSAKRRSLRVPVDEVPRRSSPSLTRPSFEPEAKAHEPAAKEERAQTERSLPRIVSTDPLPALRTDPGVELGDEDIVVDESREIEAPQALADDALDASARESEAEMVLVSSELDSVPELDSMPDLGSVPDLDASADLPSVGIETRTSPEGELSPSTVATFDDVPDLSPEPTQVSASPMLRPSLELVERPATELVRSELAPEPSRPSFASAPSTPPPAVRPSSPPPRPSSPPPPSRPSQIPPSIEARASQPVIVSPVVVVSRAIAIVGSPAAPAPAAPPPVVAASEPAPVPLTKRVEHPIVEVEGDVDVDVDEKAASEADEPIRLSQVEIAEPDGTEELAADELVEDAPVAPKPQLKPMHSAPPPRPERAARSSDGGRIAVATPLPPSMAGTLATPPLPPPPPVPSSSAPHAPPPAPPVAAPPPPAAAPQAAPLDPATDPRRSKKKGAWWEELFNDDYLRTVPAPHPRQVVRQCDFIEARLGLVRGATLLDVGCGLGLHAIELTRRGYLVVGLDLSLPMLSRAADEAQDQGFKINFLHADMREMNFDGAFDAVLSWGTSFGYFDDDVNRGVLDRIHRALKPGGLFLLDLVNRDYVVRTQPNNVWFEGDGCVVMEETQCNYISSRLHVKRTVMLDDGRQRESAYSIRLYSLHELGQMLHKSFRVVEVSGREATPGVFFGADSPRLLVVAERRALQPPGPPAPPKKHEGETAASTSMPAVPSVAPAPPSSPEGESS